MDSPILSITAQVQIAYAAYIERSQPAVKTPEVRAGELLAERGLIGALCFAVRMGLDGTIEDDYGHRVAHLLMLVGWEMGGSNNATR